ncbi:MAG: FG-GAP repeat domain-containing protein [Phycisphaerae bacterium]
MLTHLLVIGATMSAAVSTEPLLRFERVRIGDVTFEAASVFDVNNDGCPDIVSGGCWFEGPGFTRKHKIADVMRVEDYYDDFSCYPMDVNGDGYQDVITGGWWGGTLRWRENPKGKPIEWVSHDIDKCGNIETTRFWDVDGDGHVEIIPNAGGNIVVYRLIRGPDGKGTGKFDKHVIKEGGCGHGIGFGDVNGDGRGDFIVPNGWIEAPHQPYKQAWKFHEEFNLGTTSCPVLVYDVNNDGRADLIEGQAHGYGLNWWEQKIGSDGKRTWVKHPIDPDRSQYHDLALADIDNDGQVELITGKRYRAHLGHDPGAMDPVGTYYFEIDGGKFRRVTLDYGPASRASGVGIYLWVADVDGNGWKDIVAPGKEGLYLFRNLGR